MKSKEKLNNGITLVALVITIIILLILAAISIQALTNQGLFGRANDAKRESEIASIKEQIALDIYEKQLEPPVGSITDEQLETILGKYGTVNKEDGKIVGITTAKGYEILLKDIYGGETVAESVPDGAIVTPVNDITTWLKTGEISNQYSYTTIEQVIADSTCIESLMNNENAMKYLARSTEFADAICASETTMTSLGQSAYVDDTVLNSDNWVSAVCDSTYFESVLNVKVPTMTSNTTPSGEASASSSYYAGSQWYAFWAFDGRFNTEDSPWGPSGSSTVDGSWIQYKFENKVCVKKVQLIPRLLSPSYAGDRLPQKFKISGSNDGSTWTDIETFDGKTITSQSTFFVDDYTITSNNDYYQYIRLTAIGNTTAGSNGQYFNIGELQFYGRNQK